MTPSLPHAAPLSRPSRAGTLPLYIPSAPSAPPALSAAKTAPPTTANTSTPPGSPKSTHPHAGAPPRNTNGKTPPTPPPPAPRNQPTHTREHHPEIPAVKIAPPPVPRLAAFQDRQCPSRFQHPPHLQ